MQKYSIPRQIWRAIYPPLIFLGLSSIVSFAAMIVLTFVLTFQTIASGGPFDMLTMQDTLLAFTYEYLMVFQLIADVLCIVFFALMWRKVRTRIPKYGNASPPALVIALTVIMSAFVCFVISSVINIIEVIEIFPSYEQVNEALSSGSLFMQILVMGIAAPFAEELCCRGIVLNRLTSWMPKWAAVLIGSALFGLIHLNLLQGIYAFVVGVVFSLLYLRYRNLWVPIAGHMSFNLAGVLLQVTFEAAGIEEFNLLLLFVPSALIAVGCTLLLLKLTKAAVLVKAPEPESEPGKEPIQDYYIDEV